MCFDINFDGIRRLCGYNEDDIYEAKLWWSELALTILPGCYYEYSRICIGSHNFQLRKAHAVLQRLRQLSQENGAEVYIYNLHPDLRVRATSSSKTPFELNYTDQDRLDDIRRLRAEFRNIQRGNSNNSEMESNDAAIWIYKYYLRHDHYNRPGPSRLWQGRRQDCADRGGCCARECGCCEKVLYEYPLRHQDGTMYMRKVYAHCTSECGCCVITHGVYEPAPCLPNPGFVAAGRSDE
ncbi:hypothetical protein BJY00DRAFT_293754 [Aspergillus carlsbadensis]|nr:hypothetical protein BJY00DRAFT_293754 [Aspergillus carlsbadensis]